MRCKLLTLFVFSALGAVACGDGGAAIDVDAADTRADAVQDTAVTPGTPLNHRAVAAACDNERSTALPVIPDQYSGPTDCTVHEDCLAGTNGRCVGNTHDGFYCTYDACFADTDCGAFVCACGGGFRSDDNVCLHQGNCRVDANCGAGGFCSPTFGDCGDFSGVVAYYCHTAGDECVDDADCGNVGAGGPYCAYNAIAGKWLCSTQQCVG